MSSVKGSDLIWVSTQGCRWLFSSF